MGAAADARFATDSEAIRQGAAAEGNSRFGMPARDERNREPDDRVARRRGGHRIVRVESAFDAGRSGGVVEQGFQYSDVRDEGRGQRYVLRAPGRGAGSQAADDDGRRRGSGDHAADEATGFGEKR